MSVEDKILEYEVLFEVEGFHVTKQWRDLMRRHWNQEKKSFWQALLPPASYFVVEHGLVIPKAKA
jgi:hypothetical protein